MYLHYNTKNGNGSEGMTFRHVKNLQETERVLLIPGIAHPFEAL